MTTLTRWTRPECYFGAEWPDYYSAGFGRSRDSDCLEESNFETALAALGGESDTVLVIRESHWACGWIEWIAIHESDLEAIAVAEQLKAAREDYPVLDEDDLSRREDDAAQMVWADCFDVAERIAYIRRNRDQFHFHDFRDLIGCVRGQWFGGYAAELLY